MSRTSRKRVLVIGPVLPFRGGIAQHTTMLARALAEEHDCRIVSFRRLYPQRIFPGESDLDPDYKGHVEPHTEYELDSINPYTWLKAVSRIRREKPDLVLMPWWTFFLGPLFGFVAWRLQRNNIQVTFFCHNVVDHEQATWKRWLTRMVLNQGNRFIVHSNVEADRLAELVPEPKVTVHPHPIYDQFPKSTRRLPRRAGLELLFYGFVRPYKGLDVLVEAMGLLKEEDVFLTVAGEFWEGKEKIQRRIAELGVQDKVEIRPRYHSDEETADLFDRADVVVLPYRNATGSGVVPIAYHYGKPVIVTRVGGLPDVVKDGETGWIIEPSNVDALANCMDTISRARAETMTEAINNLKSSMTWDSLASTLVNRSEPKK